MLLSIVGIFSTVDLLKLAPAPVLLALKDFSLTTVTAASSFAVCITGLIS